MQTGFLRRKFLQLIGGAGAGTMLESRLRAMTAVESLVASLVPKGEAQTHVRRYRAQAIVTLLGVNIFTRTNVGAGYAVLEQCNSDDGHAVGIQFAAGSLPERAKGLNRSGYFQEVVHAPKTGHTKAAYFGFMTSSPEKSLDQAQKAIASNGGDQAAYRVIEGLTAGVQASSALQTVMAPAKIQWPSIGDLHRLFRGTRQVKMQPAAVPVETTTFLNAVRHSILDPAPKATRSIVYNGKLYRMTTEKENDGARVRVSGTMIDSTNGDKSPFRFWYEPKSPNIVPVKIEYKARSFLKLVFEHDGSLDQPAVLSTLKQA